MIRFRLVVVWLILTVPLAAATTLYEAHYDDGVACTVTIQTAGGGTVNSCGKATEMQVHPQSRATVTISPNSTGAPVPTKMTLRATVLDCDAYTCREHSGVAHSASGALPLTVDVSVGWPTLPTDTLKVRFTVTTGCAGNCVAIGSQSYHVDYVEMG